jgi:hypothetical protein
MTIDTFAFVYAKCGEIRCLTTSQRAEMDALEKDGWKHTATLNTIYWIEAVVNGDNAIELINELKGETND